MKFGLNLLVVLLLASGQAWGQEELSPAAMASPAPPKRSWMGRVLHPFSSAPKADTAPQYKDPKLRGLMLVLQLSPQSVKLSEVRQLEVKATLVNKGKKTAQLDFQNDQRVEVYLMNSAETVLTKWSDNHAITEKPGMLLINPEEHIEYNQSISTRELASGRSTSRRYFFQNIRSCASGRNS